MRTLLMLVLLFNFFVSSAQRIDSLLALEEYVALVKQHHPMMFKSALISDLADYNLTMARGGFDPKLGLDWNQKDFADKNYYNLFAGGVKIPTWYGLEFKGGYERSSGQFLDDSDALPDNGLIYGGVSLPIGQGLLMDSRRAELKKAKIFMESSQVEQQIMVNELIFEALNQYLQWQEAYFTMLITREGIELARDRLIGTVSSFVNGDKPAIDTLESFIVLQSRQLEFFKAEQDLTQARLALNNFLWLEGSIPLELENFVVPEPFDNEYLKAINDSLALSVQLIVNNHPQLLSYQYKKANFEIEQRLNLEYLKPNIRIDYNPLYETNTEFRPTQEYKLGISASYPLLLRKERGKIGITRTKIREVEFDMDLKRQDLNVKLERYFQLQNQVLQQNDLIVATVVNYDQLLRAENRKFEVGESSIFLINSREVKYLESRIKFVEGQGKLLRTRLIYLWYTGQLGTLI